MDKRKIENYISDELSLVDQKIALDFVDYLKNNEMEFVKDNGYWKDKDNLYPSGTSRCS